MKESYFFVLILGTALNYVAPEVHRTFTLRTGTIFNYFGFDYFTFVKICRLYLPDKIDLSAHEHHLFC